MKMQRSKNPRLVRHKACLVFLPLPIQAALMQVFTVTVFADQRTCSTLPFCFQLKKEKQRRKQKVKELPPARSKNVRQKNLPEATLHNVALYNSSEKVCGTHGRTCGLYKDIM
jgi:hypothetical protein